MQLDARRNVRLKARQSLLDLVHRLDDVGAGLLIDDQQDALAALERRVDVGLARESPGPDLIVLDALGGRAEIADTDRRALLVADDHVVPRLGRQDLVVGVDGQALLGPDDRALGRVGGGRHDLGPHRVDLQPARGDLARIDLQDHRRLLLTPDADQSHSINPRHLLGEDDVGVVVDLIERQGVGTEREDHDRRVGRVDLAQGRLGRQVAGELAAGGVDRRLDLLEVVAELLRKLELQGDAGRPVGARRGHLGDAGDQRELTLERGGDIRRHGLGAGAREVRADLDGGVVDVRQGGHRQADEADDADHQQRRRHQRGGYGPANEGT